MSWLQKLLPPKFSLSTQSAGKSNIPEGLWTKCQGCDETIYSAEFQKNLRVCPKCGCHHYISARERLASLLDNGVGTNIAEWVIGGDPLKFKDNKTYPERIRAAIQESHENEGLVVQAGYIKTIPVTLAVFEYAFIGGSMGSAVGERFARGVRHAIEHQQPFVCFSASGGARMQEGLLSLMQMAKTTTALGLLADQGLPFINVLTHPTMGGVSASFAMIADVVIAEPGALIGFAGPRVIEQTVREKLPEGFQRAEFLLEKGAIDRIIPRSELRDELSSLLAVLMHSLDHPKINT
jgi:acetyl-CoA carboxylase carboxyl transferase subunit beta